jgi:hypothetical protein
MAPTCFLFPVVGLMARGAALGLTMRLKPKSLGGEDNEMCRMHAVQAVGPAPLRRGIFFGTGLAPCLNVIEWMRVTDHPLPRVAI